MTFNAGIKRFVPVLVFTVQGEIRTHVSAGIMNVFGLELSPIHPAWTGKWIYRITVGLMDSPALSFCHMTLTAGTRGVELILQRSCLWPRLENERKCQTGESGVTQPGQEGSLVPKWGLAEKLSICLTTICASCVYHTCTVAVSGVRGVTECCDPPYIAPTIMYLCSSPMNLKRSAGGQHGKMCQILVIAALTEGVVLCLKWCCCGCRHVQ